MEGKDMASERSFNFGNNSKITVKDTADWDEDICVNIEITNISNDLMPVILKAVEDEKRKSVKARKKFPDVKPLIWGKTKIELMNLVVVIEKTNTIRTYIDTYFVDENENEEVAEIPINLTGYETELHEIILNGVKKFLQM
jgi:hypothetical protein